MTDFSADLARFKARQAARANMTPPTVIICAYPFPFWEPVYDFESRAERERTFA